MGHFESRLARFRRQVDRIDAEMAALLARRLKVVAEIGAVRAVFSSIIKECKKFER
jgi:chorismate mutase